MPFCDWHAQRSDLSDMALLDRAPETEGIDLQSMRRYRQARVRSQMAKYDGDGCYPFRFGKYPLCNMNPEHADFQHVERSVTLFAAYREFTGCSHLAEGY